MNVYQIYLYVNYLARKSPYGNVLNPDEYNLILPVLAFEYARKYYASPDSTRMGHPRIDTTFPINSAVSDKLDVLKKTVTEAVVANTPNNKPADYWHYSSFYATDIASPTAVDWHLIDMIPEYQARYRMNSKIIKKEIRNSFIYQIGSLFYFVWDDLIKNVQVNYLRRPTTPIMVYTIDPVTLEINYNDVSSTQFDWVDDIDAMAEIAENLLDKLGISIRDMSLVQYHDKNLQQ